MEITKDTKVSDILEEYGDIAEVVQAVGIKPVGTFSVRKVVSRFLTVERAAWVHRVPVEEFVEKIRKAVEIQEERKKVEA